MSLVIGYTKQRKGHYKKVTPKTFKEYKTPDWVDFEQIRRGQLVMNKYGFIIGFINAIVLMGGFACPEINKVLTGTGYLANDENNDKGYAKSMIRLMETGEFVYKVCYNDITPFEEGWYEIMRTRFSHCKVRKILWTKSWKP
eukprot:UN18762